MGLEDDDIFDDLKNDVDSFSLPVEEEVWGAVQSEIRADKRRKLIVWSALALLLILLTFSAAYLLNKKGNVQSLDSNPDSELSEGTEFDELKSIKDQKEPFNYEDNVQNLNEDNGLESDLNKKTKDIESKNLTAEILNSKVSQNQELEEENDIDDDKVKVNTNTSNENKSGENTVSSALTIAPGSDIIENSSEKPKKAVTQKSIPENVSKDKDVLEKVQIDQGLEIDENNGNEDAQESSIILVDDTNNDDSLGESSDTLKENQDLSSQKLNSDVSPDTSLTSIKEKENEASKVNKFSILLSGGLGFSHRNIKSDIHHDLINHKNDHEKASSAYRISVLGQYNLPAGFVRLGLSYSIYAERYDFHHDIISHTTVNDYKYLQIPVSYGQLLFDRNRNSIFLEAGMKYSILRSAQSSWVDPNSLQAVKHSNEDNNQPFSEQAYNYFLSLEYRYGLNDRLNLHIRPTYDGFFNSIYQSSTALDQKPYSFMFKMGLSYGF
ncbi:MAG: hypothetical protein MRY83_23305 [Flavobacteriales bacterium]|nr:hypothetical protein [Flavobacteriales bacterium]